MCFSLPFYLVVAVWELFGGCLGAVVGWQRVRRKLSPAQGCPRAAPAPGVPQSCPGCAPAHTPGLVGIENVESVDFFVCLLCALNCYCVLRFFCYTFSGSVFTRVRCPRPNDCVASMSPLDRSPTPPDRSPPPCRIRVASRVSGGLFGGRLGTVWGLFGVGTNEGTSPNDPEQPPSPQPTPRQPQTIPKQSSNGGL